MIRNLIHRKQPSSIERRHDPFLPLHQEIDRAINDFYKTFESPISYSTDLGNILISPSVDIVEDDKNYKVEVEMPGMGEENIKVSINEGVLSIQGKKEISKKDEGKNYVMREIGYGSYERDIYLPDYVDIDKAKASFKKGMLWVNFPKKESAQKQSRELKVEKST